MDRLMVYPGSIPLDTDILSIQRNMMVALGFLAQATLGSSTVVDGLVCLPAAPPTMTVTVGPGSMMAPSTIDATAFGSLSSDIVDPLMKIGINVGSNSFTPTAPLISGQSQTYLIEASFLEQDGSPVVLPYFNASSPSQPFSGPNNSGAPQNTKRAQTVALQMKAGAPANTGTQVTPSVDVGWTGLYIISVNFGQTQITADSISTYAGAPFVPTKLPFLRKKLNADLSLYVSASGNDQHSGLSASDPFANLQQAWNTIISSYDLNGFNVTVNVANGVYTTGLSAVGVVTGLGTGNSVMFVGNPGSPLSCAITVSNQHAISVSGQANVLVGGFSLSASGFIPSSGTPAAGLAVRAGTAVVTSAMNYGTCSGQHIWATESGEIRVQASYTIGGGAENHVLTSAAGFINLAGPLNITVNGNPTFSGAFANASQLGLIQFLSVTTSGTAIGQKYNAAFNGIIVVGITLPGTVAGATATGGQFA